MEKIYKLILIRNTRLYVTYGLVFFLLALAGCKHRQGDIAIVWKDELAVGIRIPKAFIRDYSLLRAKHAIKITLTGSNGTDGILGNFKEDGDDLVFEPLIPLSEGLTYDVTQDGKLMETIKFSTTTNIKPELLTVYPETDTVPENLLKFYFRFSRPMRSGQALEHIFLLDKNKDTMRNVFLNLQPELWDSSGKVLTLWLDPGRIKRGLVLNKQLGNPLKKSEAYTLVVSQDWNDSRGKQLAKTYTKQFVVGDRDATMPDINKWKLTIPKAGTSEPLIISSSEPLDHFLFSESVGIFDSGKMMYSVNVPANGDRILKITPIAPWEKKRYTIRVLAHIEDLAGNNLNRVFDRDIRKDTQTNKEYFERGFEVR